MYTGHMRKVGLTTFVVLLQFFLGGGSQGSPFQLLLISLLHHFPAKMTKVGFEKWLKSGYLEYHYYICHLCLSIYPINHLQQI